jgi:hypothetical protein
MVFTSNGVHMSKLLSLLPPSDVATLDDLRRIDARVSMEGEHLANFAETLRGVVPTLVDTTKSFLSRFTAKDSQLSQTEKPVVLSYNEFRKFVDLMEKQKYVAIANLRWFVPEGFSGHMLSYTAALEACALHAEGIIGEVLNPYAQFLSRIITSKNATMNTTRDLGFLAKRDVQREDLQGIVGKFFVHGSTGAKSTIGDTFSRNADWKPFFNDLGKLRDSSDRVKPEVVQGQVNDIMGLLDGLKSAVHNGELDGSSSQTLKNLSEGTLSAAREVEFYSVTMFRIFTLMNITDSNMKAMPGLLK